MKQTEIFAFTEIFALRLRQYAINIRNTKAALSRIVDIDDDDYSPSAHTPSRNECRARLNSISGTVHGYCLCVDDCLSLEHGFTEKRFYKAMRNNKDMPERYAPVESDSSYPSAQSLNAESKADKKFEMEIFHDIV